MKKLSLKTVLASGEFALAPGIQDMITAAVCNKVGFDFAYASGYWLVDLFSFQEFNRLIGFEEVWRFERKWAR